MSAPNANAPNEGILSSMAKSAENAVNYVSETVMGKGEEAKKEAGKEQAKGNTADSSISGRLSGAADAASGAMGQAKHEGSAKANKESI